MYGGRILAGSTQNAKDIYKLNLHTAQHIMIILQQTLVLNIYIYSIIPYYIINEYF